ncbi:MAG TPA: FxsA family protein [Egibacteraceae bacterium]|nr:FxsA family protein [Egibacteraceae bacterium]
MPLLVLLFIVVPLGEVWLIIRVAGLAGWGNTVALLFVVSVVGAVMVKREGAKAWRAFARALQEARVPAREVVDGALVLVGGALMVTPGFFTDVVGLVCVLPPTRALVNRALRSQVRGMFGLGALDRWGRTRGPGARPGDRDEPATLDVEVVDVRRDDPPPGQGSG